MLLPKALAIRNSEAQFVGNRDLRLILLKERGTHVRTTRNSWWTADNSRGDH